MLRARKGLTTAAIMGGSISVYATQREQGNNKREKTKEALQGKKAEGVP